VRCLLVRVGADRSGGGGSWNAPVDSASNEFAYVAIPETRAVRAGMEKPYSALAPTLSKFGVTLPDHLRARHMHLDPDFDYLSYGDQGARARQLRTKLSQGDRIVFYSGLKDVHDSPRLAYAIVGIFVVDDIVLATNVPASARNANAHSRRILAEGAQDIVVRGNQQLSGRLERCLPFGEWRNCAYRVRLDLLEAWGGLSVKDGYLQRSARLPEFLDPERFLDWFESKRPRLIRANN
jgi:Nucleotide modification associated domain 3